MSGSAYSDKKNVKIGIGLEIAVSKVATAEVFSNGPSTHPTVGPSITPYTFPFNVVDEVVQPVSIHLYAMDANTVFDVNDYLTLMAI